MSKLFKKSHYQHRLERMRQPLYSWGEVRVFLGTIFVLVYILCFILTVAWLGS